MVHYRLTFSSTRPGVPTQEKSPRTPREIVAHRRMLASMSNKIEMAVEKLDDVLAEEDRKPALTRSVTLSAFLDFFGFLKVFFGISLEFLWIFLDF